MCVCVCVLVIVLCMSIVQLDTVFSSYRIFIVN